MKQKSIYFYLAVLTVFLGICSPLLFTHGMFMDGTIYAVLAKNMALGKGSFWLPHFSDTFLPVFCEHPPMAIWIESLCFRIFGTSIFVERFYAVLCIIFIGFLMMKIWKEIVNETVTAWFPLFLFVSVPIITWTATNNMLENSMSIFICFSVWFYLIGMRKKKYYFTIFSGLSLFLGVLCKGVVAFFPWTFPFWIWIFSKKMPFKQVICDTIVLIVCTLLPLILCYISSQEAKLFFDTYLSKQLFSSVAGLKVTVESRFFILKKLFDNMIPCLVLTTGMFIALIAAKKTNLLKIQLRNSLIFFALSLCGILPIMLSFKQSGFYIVPAYPFLTIAFALPFQPFIQQLMEKINASSKGFRTFKVIVCVLFLSVIVFAFTQKGKIGRDSKELQTVFTCCDYIPPNTTISIDLKTRSQWGMQGYFARYKDITLDHSNAHTYYLHDKNVPFRLLEEDYMLVVEVENFILLKK